MNGKDTGIAAIITEFAVRMTGKNLATIAGEEFDIGGLIKG